MIRKDESHEFDSMRREVEAHLKALRLDYAKFLCSIPDARSIISKATEQELVSVFGQFHDHKSDLRDLASNLKSIEPGSEPMSILEYIRALEPLEESLGMVGDFDEELEYDYLDPKSPMNYSPIIGKILELKAVTPPEISPDVRDKFLDACAQFDEMNRPYHALMFLVSKQESPTELLLLADALDEDLKNVMAYRLRRNNKVLVMDFEDYANLAARGFELPSVIHLGLLHHYGRGIPKIFSRPEFIEKLNTIGKSLPYCRRLTERACYMDDNRGLTEVLNHDLTLFGRKGKALRDSTLVLSSTDGQKAASEYLKEISRALLQGGLGRAQSCGLMIKFYVGGYLGSIEGAKADKGDSHRKIGDKPLSDYPKSLSFLNPLDEGSSSASADEDVALHQPKGRH